MALSRTKYSLMILLIMLYIPAVALTGDPAITINLPLIVLCVGLSILLLPYIIDNIRKRNTLLYSMQIILALCLFILVVYNIFV